MRRRVMQNILAFAVGTVFAAIMLACYQLSPRGAW